VITANETFMSALQRFIDPDKPARAEGNIVVGDPGGEYLLRAGLLEVARSYLEAERRALGDDETAERLRALADGAIEGATVKARRFRLPKFPPRKTPLEVRL
jgi:hypothetical protein